MNETKQPEIISYKELESLRGESIHLVMEETKLTRYWQTLKRQWPIFVMLIPVLVYFLLFRYRPILELLVAFKSYDPNVTTDSFQSPWVGFYALRELMFSSKEYTQLFWKAFRNTFTISMYGLLFGFPIPIILALLFSEIKSDGYRSITQILSYLPKFISTVVITSLLFLMLRPEQADAFIKPGIINGMLTSLGLVPPETNILGSAAYFRSVYILSDIWEGAGYGSIVYFAAIMSISPTSYEAARIDGANKLDQIRYVTLPGMAPTLTIMLILRIGSILSVGYEKIILMTENEQHAVLETADVLSTFILRLGNVYGSSAGLSVPNDLIRAFSTSADLFNSFIAMFLVLGANFISRRVSDTSLF
ncbi:sugar ABC transporter permease [Acholeplasma equirhinis]|uniref:ABC transporter permease n=1 Tax=Acholeplasma equirhinis TaxID=555393 RepID=UPI00197B0439|nr:ABC transporter permease subunit [Acholeplasma equirhinis]MBN3490741.1 sugar ABC transporter permease [Acholeplasma equirhinis]